MIFVRFAWMFCINVVAKTIASIDVVQRDSDTICTCKYLVYCLFLSHARPMHGLVAYWIQMIGIKGEIFIRFIQGIFIFILWMAFITNDKFVQKLYSIRSFKDSDNDGIGDLNGITSKLEYLKEIGIDGVWLSPIFKVLYVNCINNWSNWME